MSRRRLRARTSVSRGRLLPLWIRHLRCRCPVSSSIVLCGPIDARARGTRFVHPRPAWPRAKEPTNEAFDISGPLSCSSLRAAAPARRSLSGRRHPPAASSASRRCLWLPGRRRRRATVRQSALSGERQGATAQRCSRLRHRAAPPRWPRSAARGARQAPRLARATSARAETVLRKCDAVARKCPRRSWSRTQAGAENWLRHSGRQWAIDHIALNADAQPNPEIAGRHGRLAARWCCPTSHFPGR